MREEKWESRFRLFFYIGLALGILVSLDFRYSFLSDYSSGLLAGVAACLILVGGILSHCFKTHTGST